MGPIRATTTCLRKSFDFSGRATRAEFWWFFATWLVFMIAGFAFVGWVQQLMIGHLPTILAWKTLRAILFIGFLLPLGAIARRHQDSGFLAILPLVAGLTALPMVYGSFGFVPLFLGVSSPLLFETLLFQVYFALFYIGITALSLVIAIFPSSPSSNRYGPNPHEVSP